MIGIEVKSGRAIRNASQIAKDKLINTVGAELFGRRAEDAKVAKRVLSSIVELHVPRWP